MSSSCLLISFFLPWFSPPSVQTSCITDIHVYPWPVTLQFLLPTNTSCLPSAGSPHSVDGYVLTFIPVTYIHSYFQLFLQGFTTACEKRTRRLSRVIFKLHVQSVKFTSNWNSPWRINDLVFQGSGWVYGYPENTMKSTDGIQILQTFMW